MPPFSAAELRRRGASLAPAAALVVCLGAVAAPAAADTLFVSSFNNGEIRRFDLPSPVETLLVSGLSNPEDGACSPSGQIFFAESNFNVLTRWEQDGSAPLNIIPTAGAIFGPEGLAFDPAGNLFVHTRQSGITADGAWKLLNADPVNPFVQIVPPFTTFGEGSELILAGPHTGAYILVDRGNTRVYMSEPPGAPISLLIDTPAFPAGVTLYGITTSGCGDIFVAYTDTLGLGPSGVYHFDPDGAFIEVYATGLQTANFLEFDSTGNLYVADLNGSTVWKVLPDKTLSPFAIVPNPGGIAICRTSSVPICPSCPSFPVATAAGATSYCEGGGPVVLDGSGSTPCTGTTLQYRWVSGATVVCGWSSTPTCPVNPTTTTTYTLEISCVGTPVPCTASDSLTITVVPYPTPSLAPVAPLCAGPQVTLDATGSSPRGCPLPLEYQFRQGATVIQPWGPSPTCVPPGPPTGTTLYSVDVRCPAAPGCSASTDTSITVVPFPVPALAPLAPICAGSAVTLDATGSGANGCPVPLEYQFRDGATVLQPWGTASTYGPISPGASTTYSVDVRCPAPPGCASSASQGLVVVPDPTPALAAIGPICAGDNVTLDAGGSAGNGCGLPLEYQFRDGAVILQPWSPASTYGPFVPGASTTYTVDVRCPSPPGCPASVPQPLTVVPPPTARAGADVVVCQNKPLTLDGSTSTSAGCPGGALYEWWDGGVLVQPASPVATWSPPTGIVGTKTYTLVVMCSSLVTCRASDDVVVTVRTCPFAVQFDTYDAVWSQAADRPVLTLTWTTLLEEDTVFFAIERAADPAGTFAQVAVAESHGPGQRYTATDATARALDLGWYRIVEYTLDGRGDETPAFQARLDSGSGPGTGGAAGAARRNRSSRQKRDR